MPTRSLFRISVRCVPFSYRFEMVLAQSHIQLGSGDPELPRRFDLVSVDLAHDSLDGPTL
jgi:hypothetical protein